MITIESSEDEDELQAALALSLQQQPNDNDNTNNNDDDSLDDEVEFIGTNNASTSSTVQNSYANNHNIATTNNNNDKIATLMSMGFNKSQCIQALQSSNGILENAISFILSGTGDSSSSVANGQQSSSLAESVASSKVSSSDIDKTGVSATDGNVEKTVDSKKSSTSTSNSSNKSNMSLADIRAEKHKRYLLSQQNNPSSSNQQQSMNGTSSSMLNSQSNSIQGRSINQMSMSGVRSSASSNVSLDGQVQVINNNLIDTNKHVHNDGGWIWVKNPTGTNSRVDSKDDVDRLLAEFSSSLSGSNYTHEQLVKLARKHNVLTGKWLIDISPANVQKDWPRIRNATLHSQLGCTSKISDEPVGNGGCYIVCIYCPDFTDKNDVLRVRQSLLRDIKIGENSLKPMNFKLDAFTHLNIYASSGGGGKKMRTTTYDCGGSKDLDCTTLVTAHETCTNSTGCPRCFPHCMAESSSSSTTDHPTLNEDQTICTGLKLIIVGVQHREENLVALDRLTLEREPTNHVDDKAIVCKNGRGGIVGYIKQSVNVFLSPHLDANRMRLDNVSLIRTTSTTLNIAVRLTLVDVNERNKGVFLQTLNDLKVKFPKRRTKKKAKTSKTNSSLLDDDGDKKPEAKPEIKPNGKLSFRDHSTSSDSSTPITLVSWNVSEFDNPISARAPNPLQRMRESSNLIRDECFNHSTYLPDVIALQETPDSYWGTKTFGSYGYTSVGSATSHCGTVDLLVRKDFLQEGDSMSTPPRLLDSYNQLPSVATLITLPNKTNIAISSSHLAPFNNGAAAREESIRSLVGSLSRKCNNVITIGDMNMRVAEDKKIEGIAGDDAWKVVGSNNESKYPWNVFVNPYHENGFRNRARYDRCYVKGNKVSVTRFDLIGNTPVEVEGDYLSDHFGIIVEVTVKPPPSLEAKRGSATLAKAKLPQTNNYQQHTRRTQDIIPIKPTRSPPLVNSNKAQRYIIYMAIHEEHGSKFEQGLAKCKEACHADIQHCLQMDGTRHVTMYDGNLTSDQFRGLSFSGQFDSTEISFQGWCPWDAGCYLQLDKQSIQCLKSLLSQITGLPSLGGKRPCDHLSLYRQRPNTRHPNPKQAFAKIRDSTRNVDFGSVKGVSICIKTLGSPYDECLVLAESSEKGEKKTASKTSDRVAKAKPRQLNYQQHTKRTQDTSDSDYEGVKESEETLQRANGKRAKVSAAAAAVKKKEQKKQQASMETEASKMKKNIYGDSSSDEDEGFDEMKRKLLAKRAAASHTKDDSSSDDEVQVVQKKAPVYSSTNDRKRKAPPPPSSSSSEDEEEEFDYEAYAREAAMRRAKARES